MYTFYYYSLLLKLHKKMLFFILFETAIFVPAHASKGLISLPAAGGGTKTLRPNARGALKQPH